MVERAGDGLPCTAAPPEMTAGDYWGPWAVSLNNLPFGGLMDKIYTYCWKNNSVRKTLYGRECRILHRCTMNTRIIEFIDNGQRQVVSGNALRRLR